MIDDFDAWLDEAKPLEATVSICLSGDLHQQHADKAQELLALVTSKDLSMEDERIPRLRTEIDALAVEIGKHSRKITVKRVDESAYYKLILSHPPREGDERDAVHGVNYDTFTPELVRLATGMSAVQVSKLRGLVSYRQWAELWQTAQEMSSSEVAVPKLLPDFGLTPSSAVGSSRPTGSGSPSAGSKGGSRRRSTSTKGTG